MFDGEPAQLCGARLQRSIEKPLAGRTTADSPVVRRAGTTTLVPYCLSLEGEPRTYHGSSGSKFVHVDLISASLAKTISGFI